MGRAQHWSVRCAYSVTVKTQLAPHPNHRYPRRPFSLVPMRETFSLLKTTMGTLKMLSILSYPVPSLSSMYCKHTCPAALKIYSLKCLGCRPHSDQWQWSDHSSTICKSLVLLWHIGFTDFSPKDRKPICQRWLYPVDMALLEVCWPHGCAGNGWMFEMKEEDALTEPDWHWHVFAIGIHTFKTHKIIFFVVQ